MKLLSLLAASFLVFSIESALAVTAGKCYRVTPGQRVLVGNFCLSKTSNQSVGLTVFMAGQTDDCFILKGQMNARGQTQIFQTKPDIGTVTFTKGSSVRLESGKFVSLIGRENSGLFMEMLGNDTQTMFQKISELTASGHCPNAD